MNAKVNAELIDNYRKENYLTVKQFCKKCRISTQTYYKFVNGNLNMRINVLMKISRTMNVACADIIEIEE